MRQIKKTIYPSLLFTPVFNDKQIKKAVGLDCAAVILDLEASVPNDRKEESRDMVVDAVKFVQEQGKSAFVRVNPRDLEDALTVCRAGADGLMVPLVETQEDLTCFVKAAEETGLELPPILPIIETPKAIVNLEHILDTDVGVLGVAFAGGDFTTGMGSRAKPGEDLLFNAAWKVAVHSRARGLNPYGTGGFIFMVSTEEEIAAFKASCEQARDIGMVGMPAIHPKQLSILNDVFMPSQEEFDYARRAIKAFEEGGEHIIFVDGKVMEYPVYYKLKQFLEEYE